MRKTITDLYAKLESKKGHPLDDKTINVIMNIVKLLVNLHEIDQEQIEVLTNKLLTPCQHH